LVERYGELLNFLDSEFFVEQSLPPAERR
jgi:hypothetical protein